MYRILVVDDEINIINILDRFLTKSGFEVMKALGGKEAVIAINSDKKIDLVITDIKMPDINGVEVVKEMIKLKKNIPVLVLSGTMGMMGEMNELRDLGYVDVFYKPIELDNLLEMVKNKLGI